MGDGRGAYRFWWVNLSEMDHLEDPGTDEKIISRWIFRKGNQRAWTGLFWIRRLTGTRKCGKEPLGSLKYREFLN
jgi:hypothetical protein